MRWSLTTPEDLGNAGDVPRGLIEVAGPSYPGGQGAGHLPFDDRQLPGVGLESHIRPVRLLSLPISTWPATASTDRVGFSEWVPPMAREKGGRQTMRLRKPRCLLHQPDRGRGARMRREPIHDQPEYPVLVVYQGWRKRRMRRIHLLKHFA